MDMELGRGPADILLARRIEAAETWLTRSVVEAAIASGQAPRAFLRELGAGVAAYVRPSSPMNKLIGVGLTAPIDPMKLAKVEALMRACKEPTRIELSTLAAPVLQAWLKDRGYRQIGLENVLVRPLERALDLDRAKVPIERVTPETLGLWKRVTTDASSEPDETGQAVDQFSRDTIAEAVEDFLHVRGFERYLARLDGAAAGGASLLIHDGLAMLGGSATLSAFRLRGVQTALIAARLADARQRRAELAVVTTAPGSRSELNLIKRGFSIAYGRQILLRD